MPDDDEKPDPAPAPERALAPSVGPSAELPAPRSLNPIRPWELALVVAIGLALLLPGLGSFMLIDPWETHYAEVGRRMLEEEDWVLLRWQNEIFRSKPALTFWLIGGGMKLLGVASGGGYSGEIVSNSLTIWAVRLPFALFGVFGLAAIWLMLARLVNRRVAWIAFAVCATTPFYFLVARQAITDMPMAACLVGAVACFALAVHSGDRPLTPLVGRLTAYHFFLIGFAVIVLPQLAYYLGYFRANPGLARGMRIPQPGLWLVLPCLLLAAWFVAWTWKVQPARTVRQVYMYWFYALLAISVLGKGPPAIGVAGLICFLYLLLTGEWRLVKKVEIPQGILIVVLIAVPWHVAILFKDGLPWVNEYLVHHMWKRTTEGVFGDRGTFNYFVQQIGIGMWPWCALVPAALTGLMSHRLTRSREDKVRLLMGIWAITGFAFFCLVQTKFHHYVLPAVPALAILVAFWLDDLLAGRARGAALAAAVAVTLVLLVARDLISEQKQFIELFIFRYDRPWPSQAPWKIDLSGPLLSFAVIFALLFALLAVRRFRREVLYGLMAAAVAFAYFTMNKYMGTAADHWGQGALHAEYYRLRHIQGVDLTYYDLGVLADDWGGGRRAVEVRSVLPDELAEGQPMVVGIEAASAKVELAGQAARLDRDGDRFFIELPEAELHKLDELVAKGRAGGQRSNRPTWVSVRADRLLAWQLNWRGENFWSGGELWGRSPDTQTVFIQTDNKSFLEYLAKPHRVGQKFFVITEASRAATLKGALPTKTGKDSVEVVDDTSCNKFTLLSFTL